MDRASLACPCCGYRTLGEAYGSYEICPICFWEDDPVQLANPALRGGANKVSLHEAQQSYLAIGVSEARFASFVRQANEADHQDPDWGPLNAAIDAEGDRAIRDGTSYFHATGEADLLTPYWKSRT